MTDQRRAAAAATVLALAVGWLYAPVLGFEFLDYDDRLYVTDQPIVQEGWTWAGVAWAWTATEAANWHPLTWLSHMLDVELFGLDPGAHHATNVAIHASASVLLFVVLRSIAGSTGRAAFAAAFFALHPLRVESVAWVAERKDVLCGLFSIATLGLYGRYARRPGPLRYGAVALGFAAALMSKAMAVTLPAVLLVFDVWPLGRLRRGPAAAGRASPRYGLGRLVLEKLPLLVVSGVASLAALAAQHRGEALSSLGHLGLLARAENAIVSYARHLRRALWPNDLAAFYPYPVAGLAASEVVVAVAVLLLVTLAAVQLRRSSPALLAGWLVFVGMLVPVIGLFQVGEQAMADRYSYLPSIGLGIAAAWAAPSSWGSSRLRLAGMAAVALCVLTALTAVSRSILPAWQNDETLFARALAVSGESRVAHLNYGHAIEGSGRMEEQVHHFRRATELGPGDGLAPYNLARILFAQRKLAEAGEAVSESIRRDPTQPRAWNLLGNVVKQLGREREARAHYERALALDAEYPTAHFNLALLDLEAGDPSAAADRGERYFAARPSDRESLRILTGFLAEAGAVDRALGLLRRFDPEPEPQMLSWIGELEWRRGHQADAIAALERAHEHAEDARIAQSLARMLAATDDPQLRDPERAAALCEALLQADPAGRDADLLDTLAMAHAAAGRFARARSLALEAEQAARTQGAPALAEAIAARSARYEAPDEGQGSVRRGGAPQQEPESTVVDDAIAVDEG